MYTTKKGGDVTGYDEFKTILGIKIHVAAEQNGLPISIRISPTNAHDRTRFVDVIQNISNFIDDSMMDEIVAVYADKSYDAAYIRNYLRCRGIGCCWIPSRKNSRFTVAREPTKCLQQDNVCCREILCLAQMRVQKDCDKIRKEL